MTSTADTGGHPEVSEISALTEGILPPERSAGLRDHLAGCGLCTDVRRSLDEIRGLLGTLPGPARMPSDVADRIDAALAAEALINTAAPAEAPDGDPRDSRLRDACVSRETPPPPRRPAGGASTPTGPGRPRAGRRRSRALLATACSAALLIASGLAVHSLTTRGTSEGSPTATGRPTDTFSGVALSERVHQLLATASPTAGVHAGENTPMHTDIGAVPACVLRGTGRSGEPLASSRGTYHDHDAYLVVMTAPSGSSQVDAYVVDASCASAASPAPGRVLARHSYHRS